ncbi:MAG: ATP-binding protein [Bacillota bacterium]
MKEIAVISGKGGTGKTSLVASFASLAASGWGLVLADCDVDAPDLHLLLHPEVRETHDFRASRRAFIDAGKCTGCGLCEARCRFGAVRGTQIDPLSCEGCGVCHWVCPVQAVTMREELSGHWYVSETRYGPMVHARLEPGEENSGRLVTVVRRRARELAEERDARLLITDGPPGVGCPVISTVGGAGLAVVVTEPTLSGIHDLVRVLDVCRHFGVAAVVCINRYDLHPAGAREIEQECQARGVPLAGCIPYDPVFTEAIVHGKPLVEFADGPVSHAVMEVWREVTRFLESGGPRG